MSDKDLEWEKFWWGTCQNTFGEESKQIVYASRMGLKFFHDGRSPYNIEMENKSVLDIGGGPTSLLLKCLHVRGIVADPCHYPDWIYQRYETAGIEQEKISGEEIEYLGFDEVWIYNVLQHTHDPELVIRNAKRAGSLVRIFEWIDTYVSKGHPHILTEEKLNQWLGGIGKTGELKGEGTCCGKYFSGVFIGGDK